MGEWAVSTISAILLKNSTFEGGFFILSLARNTKFEFLYIVGHNKKMIDIKVRKLKILEFTFLSHFVCQIISIFFIVLGICNFDLDIGFLLT